MSLKKFHLFFISISALLSLFLITRGEGGIRAFGLILLVILIPYAVWFWRKAKLLGLSVFVAVFCSIPEAAHACAVCFRNPDSLLTRGAKMGVLALAVTVAVVLATIGWTAFTWSQRARQPAQKS